MDQEKEKRKGTPAYRSRWLYVVRGFVAGALFTVIGVFLYDVQSAGLGISSGAYTVISIVFAFSIIFLVLAGLVIVAGNAYSPTATLRQKPDDPRVIQQLINQRWEDRLTLTPVETKTVVSLPPPEKAKTPPRSSSFLWMIGAALLTSLYGLFLSRPSQEKDNA